MSDVVVFTSNAPALIFEDSKGKLHTISPEGAVHKGGRALAALKDRATDSAVAKALCGRYYPAVDIIGVAFPSLHRAGMNYLIGGPGANKANFLAHCQVILSAQPKEGKDWTVKQDLAREMARVLTANLTESAPVADTAPVAE